MEITVEESFGQHIQIGMRIALVFRVMRPRFLVTESFVQLEV